MASGEISFLQGETSPPSDEECLQLLADEKVLIHAVLNTPDEDTEEAGGQHYWCMLGLHPMHYVITTGL